MTDEQITAKAFELLAIDLSLLRLGLRPLVTVVPLGSVPIMEAYRTVARQELTSPSKMRYVWGPANGATDSNAAPLGAATAGARS